MDGQNGDQLLLSRQLYMPVVEEPNFVVLNKRQNDKKASPSYLRDSEYIMEATDLDFSIQHQNRPRRQRRPDQSGGSNYRRIDSGGSDNSYYNYEPVNPRHKGKGKNCLRNIVQFHLK